MERPVSSMSSPQCDVLVPFRGRTDMLEVTLRAWVASHPVGTLYLVNDGSSRAERTHACRVCDELGLAHELLDMPRPLGFVGAMNVAWRATSSEHVLLLNSDALACTDVGAALQAALHEGAHLAGVASTSTNRRDLLQYRARLTTRGTEAITVADAPFLTAMCLLLRRAAVGDRPFDPVYAPGYFEDLDLSCRLRAEGWSLGVVEQARVHHVGGATTRSHPSCRATMARNFDTFRTRWKHLPDFARLKTLLYHAPGWAA